jgi:hypothetical protein
MRNTSLSFIPVKLSLITFETGFLDAVGRTVVLGADIDRSAAGS